MPPQQRPPYGPPPFPQPPRNDKRRTAIAAIAVVVALALVVGGGLGLYFGVLKPRQQNAGPVVDDPDTPAGNGEKKPGQPAGTTMRGKVAWSDTFLPNDPFDTHPAGTWLTDSLFVRGTHSRLVAYERKTGKQAWQLDAPENRKFCGMTTSTEKGKGAVALDSVSTEIDKATGQPSRLCKDVQVVDLTTGKAIVTTNLKPRFYILAPKNATIEIVGGAVIFRSNADYYGISANTGKKLWGNVTVKRGEETCLVQDVLPSPSQQTFVGLWGCGWGDQAVLFTSTIAPASGAVARPVDLPKGSYNPRSSASATLLSAEPTVVVLPPYWDAQGKGSLAVVDEAGKVTATIPQTGDYGQLDLANKSQTALPPVPGPTRARYVMRIFDNVLYASTVPKQVSELRDENSVVAFDLSTGKPAWTTKVGDSIVGIVAGADESGAIVMRSGTYENPPQVFRFAAADGKQTALSPAYDRDYISTPTSAILTWADDQVLLVPWRQRPSVPGEPPAASVIAFG